MVIRYAYLWRSEHLRGLEEGVKNRPCAVLLAVLGSDGAVSVIALPITHTPPHEPDGAVEIPPKTKRRLGLDDERSWIVITEANRFRWPGPDLRPVHPEKPMDIVYGELPGDLFRAVKKKWLEAVTRPAIVRRTE